MGSDPGANPHHTWTPQERIFTQSPRPAETSSRWNSDYLEEYIGNNLRLIPHAQVVQEIKYRHNGKQGSCADWICVLPEVVVVIECKAIRPRRDMTAGTPASADKLRDAFKKGLGQVSTTLKRIEEQHPSFKVIPRDRPVVGLLSLFGPALGF